MTTCFQTEVPQSKIWISIRVNFAYDKGGHLTAVTAQPQRLQSPRTIVASITYNEKHQRAVITFGTGITTTYTYASTAWEGYTYDANDNAPSVAAAPSPDPNRRSATWIRLRDERRELSGRPDSSRPGQRRKGSPGQGDRLGVGHASFSSRTNCTSAWTVPTGAEALLVGRPWQRTCELTMSPEK